MVTGGLQRAALLRLASANAGGGSYSGVFLVLVLGDLGRLLTGKTTESQRTPTVGEPDSDREKERQARKQEQAESTGARARRRDPESQRTPTLPVSPVIPAIPVISGNSSAPLLFRMLSGTPKFSIAHRRPHGPAAWLRICQ